MGPVRYLGFSYNAIASKDSTPLAVPFLFMVVLLRLGRDLIQVLVNDREEKQKGHQ